MGVVNGTCIIHVPAMTLSRPTRKTRFRSSNRGLLSLRKVGGESKKNALERYAIHKVCFGLPEVNQMEI